MISEKPLLPTLLSVNEVAAWLHTSNKAVYTMVERNQIPGIVRIGRRLLFDRSILLSWIEEKRALSSGEN